MKQYILIALLFFGQVSFAQENFTIDPQLKPISEDDERSVIFENVVAIQNKAHKKAGQFLFNPSFSFDFSDSPYTMYTANLNIGYAPSEFWEIYLALSPLVIANERSISQKVRSLVLQNGQQAEISTEKAKAIYGAEILWSPIYGKDSWGPYGIIRSDTFLGFGASIVQYTSGTGFRAKLSLGKTFFVSKWFNVRFSAGTAALQTITLGKKDIINIGLIETGLVYYF